MPDTHTDRTDADLRGDTVDHRRTLPHRAQAPAEPSSQDVLQELLRLTNEATGETEVVPRGQLIERTFFAAHSADEAVQAATARLLGMEEEQLRQARRVSRLEHLLQRQGLITVATGVLSALTTGYILRSTKNELVDHHIRTRQMARTHHEETAKAIDKLESLTRAADVRVQTAFQTLHRQGE